ncbi:MAG: aldose 1-epimerase [Mycobacteriales bacterium]
MSSPDGSPGPGRLSSFIEVTARPTGAGVAPPAPPPDTRPVPPSGAQIELRWGDQRATVVEVGGGLREYDVGGRQVLDGYDRTAMCTGGRGQVLVPWPNRIADGRYEYDGQPMQLPLSEPVEKHAIHGLTRWASWQLTQPDPATVLAAYLLHPQPGYPFTLRCATAYQLGPDGLTVELAVTNRSERAAPVGLGTHPYLFVGDPLVNAARLRVPARTRLVSDRRGIPTGREDVTGTAHDFREPRPVGDLLLDTAYTDLVRDPDGRARVWLTTPDGWETVVWADQNWPYLQVYTGDTLAVPERRRSVAVEPMTCPPNAFNRTDEPVLLAPAATIGGSWGIRAQPV